MNPLHPLPPPGGRAACTIISKNYLAQARVLANSFHTYHPDIPFFVLLADREDGCIDPSREPFELVHLDQLLIPNLNRFCFQYTILELNTAVKPYFLSYLFAEYGFRHLLYFDPDILILNELEPLFALLNQYAIVVTPHLTEPLPQDGFKPDELDILRAGTYNLGFVALASAKTTLLFLSWWQARLYEQCRMEPALGMHVDQRWVDLIPGFFPDVHILRDPGYNIAYWNLPARSISLKSGTVTVNNAPAYFFHFSGYHPETPEIVSQHSSRLRIENIGQAAQLLKRYDALLHSQGYAECSQLPYAFGSFDNGVRIPHIARRIYSDLGTAQVQFGNPFQTGMANSFYDWLCAGPTPESYGTPPLSRLWHEIYKRRGDLHGAFPDIFGQDRDRFCEWIIESGAKEYDIAPRFIPAPATARTQVDRAHSENARAFGVNLSGHLRSEKGVGEAVRSVMRLLDAAQVSYVLNDLEDPFSLNRELIANVHADNPYRVNLLVLAADAKPFLALRSQVYFANHYNIGHWAWELQDFPVEFLSNLEPFHQVWVASSFVAKGLKRVTGLPVNVVPYTLTGELPAPSWHRLHLGLPQNQFVFLFMFDFHSVMERKNPVGLMRAFKHAFRQDDNAMLLLKCHHSEEAPEALAALQAAAYGANIRILDASLAKSYIQTLLSLCDAYVSLHRAEGFGLTLAEAMALEKPVIATGYSGNLDFMTRENSYLVNHRLIPLARDLGPYKKDFVWAEPDLQHAAHLMRLVYEQRDAAQQVGKRARRDVLEKLHPSVVAPRVRELLGVEAHFLKEGSVGSTQENAEAWTI